MADESSCNRNITHTNTHQSFRVLQQQPLTEAQSSHSSASSSRTETPQRVNTEQTTEPLPSPVALDLPLTSARRYRVHLAAKPGTSDVRDSDAGGSCRNEDVNEARSTFTLTSGIAPNVTSSLNGRVRFSVCVCLINAVEATFNCR